jgi:hypothetical protein
MAEPAMAEPAVPSMQSKQRLHTQMLPTAWVFVMGGGPEPDEQTSNWTPGTF